MRVVLWVYIALFVTVSLASILDPDPALRTTAADTALDVLITIVALIGLVAYALRLNAPRLITAWRFVAPALLIAFVGDLIVAWPEMMAPDPELSSTEHYLIVSLALAATILLLTPAVIVNFRFARARHLDAVR